MPDFPDKIVEPKWAKDGKPYFSNKKKCGRPTKQNSWHGPKGSPCTRPAGWGTDHIGYGACKFHGGMFPNERKKAALEEAADIAMQVMGPAIDIEPMEALLMCIRIVAGEVAYATWKIEQLEEGDAAGPVLGETYHTGGKDGNYHETRSEGIQLNVWIIARRDSLDRLAKYSKMAMDAGVAQRQIELAEQAGDQLATTIRTILDGLNLTAAQEEKAPVVVRQALAQLERGTEEPIEVSAS